MTPNVKTNFDLEIGIISLLEYDKLDGVTVGVNLVNGRVKCRWCNWINFRAEVTSEL